MICENPLPRLMECDDSWKYPTLYLGHIKYARVCLLPEKSRNKRLTLIVVKSRDYLSSSTELHSEFAGMQMQVFPCTRCELHEGEC